MYVALVTPALVWWSKLFAPARAARGARRRRPPRLAPRNDPTPHPTHAMNAIVQPAAASRSPPATAKCTSPAPTPAAARITLPTPCVQNHAANLLALPGGDLLCACSAAPRKAFPTSRSTCPGCRPAAALDAAAEAVGGSGALRTEPGAVRRAGRPLWLLYTAQLSGHQNTAIVRRRISDDGGAAGARSRPCSTAPAPSCASPSPCCPTAPGLPVFLCRTQPGERWVGNDDVSAVMVSEDRGA